MKISKFFLTKAFLFALLAAFCGGSVVVSAKIALESFYPFTLVFIRFFIATLFMVPFVLQTRELSIKNIQKFAGIGIISALNPILLFIALPNTQASVSPLIYAAVPAMTAIYLFLNGRQIHKSQFLGIGLGLIGVSIIVLLPLFDTQVSFSALKGNVLIFMAALAFTVYGLMSKKFQKESGVTPKALTFYFCFYTLLISIPFMIFELSHLGIQTPIQVKHIMNAIYVGIVGTGIFYLSYQNAVKLGSAVAASLFTFIQPVVTIGLAVLFLGEDISAIFIFGGILAIVGAWIASQ